MLQVIRALAALAFAPTPASARRRAEICRSMGEGEAPGRAAGNAGERGDDLQLHSACRCTLSPAPRPYPEAEHIPVYRPHPALRAELTDPALSYRLAVWTEEASQ